MGAGTIVATKRQTKRHEPTAVSRNSLSTRLASGQGDGATDWASLTDEALMIRFRDVRDHRAFETLVHRYERKLFGYLFGILHNTSLAEEVFQTTFLRVHVKCGSFATQRSFRPWLYAIATHQAIDAMRRERRHRRAGCRSTSADEGGLDSLAADCPSPEEEAVGREEQYQIRRTVGRLPAIHRTAVQLIYSEGLAYREAAEVMGVPVGTVKSRVHAALASLGRVWSGPAVS